MIATVEDSRAEAVTLIAADCELEYVRLELNEQEEDMRALLEPEAVRLLVHDSETVTASEGLGDDDIVVVEYEVWDLVTDCAME